VVFIERPSHCEWLSEKTNKTYEIFDTPIQNADGSISRLAIFHDITHRKIIEEEKEKLQAQLLQSQKMEAIGTLAGGIAHDFNNLLQVILGYSELMLQTRDPDNSDHGDLQKIYQSARSGAELVKRLMIFSRKIEPKFVNLDLNKHIIQTQKLLTRTIPKMIDIHLDLSDDIEQINADPTQVEQILMNLAVNARDAMPEGGRLNIATKTAILDEDYCKEHAETKPGKYVSLTVTDTGKGMDKETVKRIFEPFFTTKELGGGTGLGLAVVYGIVQQHGGHIWCYSEPSRGTVFKIYFPAFMSEEKTEEKSIEPLSFGGTETILLVDDEESVRSLAQTTLTRTGYTVLTARNGEEALGVYNESGKGIALVILDLMMPKIGGTQCLKELLKMNPTVKVVIASGDSAGGGREKYVGLGAKGFIEKPYESRILLNIVRSVLDSD
jgi:signal transduction histidine kinase